MSVIYIHYTYLMKNNHILFHASNASTLKYLWILVIFNYSIDVYFVKYLPSTFLYPQRLWHSAVFSKRQFWESDNVWHQPHLQSSHKRSSWGEDKNPGDSQWSQLVRPSVYVHHGEQTLQFSEWLSSLLWEQGEVTALLFFLLQIRDMDVLKTNVFLGQHLFLWHSSGNMAEVEFHGDFLKSKANFRAEYSFSRRWHLRDTLV